MSSGRITFCVWHSQVLFLQGHLFSRGVYDGLLAKDKVAPGKEPGP